MKNTHHIVTGAILISGLTLLLSGSVQKLEGSITSQGSTLTAVEQVLHSSASLRPAAFQHGVVRSVGPDLAIGMLLIVLGLWVHAFFVVRKQTTPSKNSGRRVLGIIQMKIWR